MTNEEIRETRLKVLEKDLASINNRLHHAFNQGFELGRKSTTPKEKTGHWINNHTQCSKCEWGMEDDVVGSPMMLFFPYCPNCGCHMIEPQESEG